MSTFIDFLLVIAFFYYLMLCAKSDVGIIGGLLALPILIVIGALAWAGLKGIASFVGLI